MDTVFIKKGMDINHEHMIIQLFSVLGSQAMSETQNGQQNTEDVLNPINSVKKALV